MSAPTELDGPNTWVPPAPQSEPVAEPRPEWASLAGAVWVNVHSGDVVVTGRPWDVEPDDIADDHPHAHNCDAAGCSSVSHVVARGRIAGREGEVERLTRERDARPVVSENVLKLLHRLRRERDNLGEMVEARELARDAFESRAIAAESMLEIVSRDRDELSVRVCKQADTIGRLTAGRS